MDKCDKYDTVNFSIGSPSFHYAWQEKAVLFSHKRKQNEQWRKTGIKKVYREEQFYLK